MYNDTNHPYLTFLHYVFLILLKTINRLDQGKGRLIIEQLIAQNDGRSSGGTYALVTLLISIVLILFKRLRVTLVTSIALMD